MSEVGSPSAYVTPASPPSHRGLKIVAGVALVLAIGGGAYGIASALGQGGSSNPSTTPSTTAPTRPAAPGSGAGGRFPAARPQAFGTVQSVGSSSFAVKESNGSSVTVETSSTTTFRAGTTGSASFSDVKVGAHVVAFGTLSGSSLKATTVEIVPAGFGGRGGGFGGGFGPGGAGTAGTVTSVGSKSFVMTTFSGSTVTVEVSGTTNYLARGASSASLADVKPGERVVVAGSGTTTIKASTVDVLGAGGFRVGAGSGFGGGSSASG